MIKFNKWLDIRSELYPAGILVLFMNNTASWCIVWICKLFALFIAGD